MKQANAEIVKNTTHESMDMQQMLQEAQQKVADEKMEAQEAEEDVRSLELELMQAQAAHEQKEEAERRGKETSEKINEVTS